MDKQVLEFIQEILGFGHLFNGNLVLPKRQETFYLFVKGFNKWVTKGRIQL